LNGRIEGRLSPKKKTAIAARLRGTDESG